MAKGSAESPGRVERLPGLDALRLLAALAVVAYHGLFRGPHSPWGGGLRFPGLEDVAVYGCLGVDLFFVVSGFVIAWSAEGRDAAGFARARLLRLWPGFAVCMTLSAAVQAVAGGSDFSVTSAQWLANLTLVPPLFRQPFVDGAYWTIVAEITFYGWVWLAIATGLFQRRLLTLGWVWLAVALANHVAFNSVVLKHLMMTNYAGQFLGGLLLYRFSRERGDLASACLLGASVAMALMFGAVTEIHDFQLKLGYEMNANLMRSLTALAFVIVAAASQARLEGRAATLAYVAGGLTYPTYLLHQNVEYVLSARLVELGAPPLAAFLGIAASVLGVAYVVFRWIEPQGKAALAWTLDAAVGLAQPARAEKPETLGRLFATSRVRAGTQ